MRAEALAGERRGRVIAVLVASLVWMAAVAAAPLGAAPRESAPHWRQPAALVYLAAAVICHQRPERSYRLGGVPLPLCARCMGVHAGAALGLVVLAAAPASWMRRLQSRLRLALAVAALPTVVSVGVEWLGGPSPLPARTLSALPAGMMAGLLVGLAIAGAARAPAGPRRQPSATLR